MVGLGSFLFTLISENLLGRSIEKNLLGEVASLSSTVLWTQGKIQAQSV